MRVSRLPALELGLGLCFWLWKGRLRGHPGSREDLCFMIFQTHHSDYF